MTDSIASAFTSIWNNKARSFLTVLGVVIGVASVTTLIALGQGLRNDVSSIVKDLGTNMIAVTSGKIDLENSEHQGMNPASMISSTILTMQDFSDIANNPKVEVASPMGIISKPVKYGDKTATPTIIGCYPEVTQVLDVMKLESGSVFERRDSGNEIVLNYLTRKRLFGDSDPVGQTVMIGDREFTVVGSLEKALENGIGAEYNNMALIPFDTATEINAGQIAMNRIIAKIGNAEEVKTAKQEIFDTLLVNHRGVEEFTVLTQDDILDMFDSILGLITTMVSAIAAISLIVGGIGIMNIMLVTVTERTKEIGLRKAVGAAQHAILSQFLIEAIVITLLGGLIGLGIAVVATQLIEARSTLHPAVTWEVVLTAIGISTVIGVAFGIWPAMRAARKDPIEALRYE
ncbi:MAG: Macrolide export ATP-binding/permease protein MacB [bacterium ADurb.Bin400]|nr:MAG: Macrolide export ATP-binding/permease protein MacB [bacterium ADurb.Bin400]